MTKHTTQQTDDTLIAGSAQTELAAATNQTFQYKLVYLVLTFYKVHVLCKCINSDLFICYFAVFSHIYSLFEGSSEHFIVLVFSFLARFLIFDAHQKENQSRHRFPDQRSTQQHVRIDHFHGLHKSLHFLTVVTCGWRYCSPPFRSAGGLRQPRHITSVIALVA